MITPCIDIFCQLAAQIHNDLGLRQGSKHSPPDLTRDIQELMRSLREHGVYIVEDGRIISGEKPCVPNTISQGLRSLAEPLKAYNHAFTRLQRRCRMQPLVGKAYYSPEEEETGIGSGAQSMSDPSVQGEDEGEGEGEDEGEDETEDPFDMGNDQPVFSLDGPEDLEIEGDFDMDFF